MKKNVYILEDRAILYVNGLDSKNFLQKSRIQLMSIRYYKKMKREGKKLRKWKELRKRK